MMKLIFVVLVFISLYTQAYQKEVYMVCQSIHGEFSQCNAGGLVMSANLRQQYSQANCIPGHSWGYWGANLWVNYGCRAEFRVIVEDNMPPVQTTTYNLICESMHSNYNVCYAQGLQRARLITQLSSNPCIPNTTWGTRQNAIWVNYGCRAVFEVTVYGTPY